MRRNKNTTLDTQHANTSLSTRSPPTIPIHLSTHYAYDYVAPLIPPLHTSSFSIHVPNSLRPSLQTHVPPFLQTFDAPLALIPYTRQPSNFDTRYNSRITPFFFLIRPIFLSPLNFDQPTSLRCSQAAINISVASTIFLTTCDRV